MLELCHQRELGEHTEGGNLLAWVAHAVKRRIYSHLSEGLENN